MLITDPESLSVACRAIREVGTCAFDTEFVFERTYRPALGLIQLAAPGGPAVAVDPLAVRDLTPVWELLLDDAVQVVVHAGTMDWTIVYHAAGRLPRNVFDSQIAASFLGYGAQIGYAPLVESTLGVRVDKVETHTDWLRRPLTDKQLEYALKDVTHLLDVYVHLVRELSKRGRTDWVREENERAMEPGRFRTPDPDLVYRDLRRAASLRRNEQVVLRELAAWREREAVSRDLRPHILLRDDLLIALARRAPQNEADLGQVRGIPAAEVKRSTGAILAAVARALALPEDQWPVFERPDASDPLLDISVGLLLAAVQLRAREEEISSETLASRGTLKAILRGGLDAVDEHGTPVLSTWRKNMLGADLTALCAGQAALAIDPATKRPRLHGLR